MRVNTSNLDTSNLVYETDTKPVYSYPIADIYHLFGFFGEALLRENSYNRINEKYAVCDYAFKFFGKDLTSPLGKIVRG